MAEVTSSHFTHVREASEGFSYGRASARFGGLDSLNSAASKMARRVQGLTDVLGIPVALGLHAIHHDTQAAFVHTTIGSKSFFLMARNPIDGRSIESITQRKTPDLSIVSGPCLFGGEVAVARGVSGRAFSLVDPDDPITEPIEELRLSSELSLYEVEAISRYGGILGELTAQTPHLRRVALNIPQAEYYSYVLPAYESGYITQEHLLEWCASVDERHARVFSAIESRILRHASLDRELEVIDFKPLDPIREYFITSIKRGEIPELKTACEILAESSPLWKDMLSVSSPVSWLDLDHLSYAYAELAIASMPRRKGKIPHVAIAIESPIEARIFAQAKAIAANLPGRVFNLVGLYPHEHIVESRSSGRTMYFTSTTHPAGRREAIRDILRAY